MSGTEEQAPRFEERDGRLVLVLDAGGIVDLGPIEAGCEAMADFLGQRDFGER